MRTRSILFLLSIMWCIPGLGYESLNCDEDKGMVDIEKCWPKTLALPEYCSSPRNTVENEQCLAIAFKNTDAELNIVYKRVMRQLSKPDIQGQVHYAEAKRELIKAQRAWIVYRESDCNAAYALAVGGTIRGTLFTVCKRDRTMHRIKELEQYLEP